MEPDRPVPRNIRSSGALIAANRENGIVISTGYLRPGDIRSGRVMIVNVGSAPGNVRLTETGVSNGFGPGELTLAVDDITDANPLTVFVGEIGELPAAGIDLGRFERDQSRRFRFLAMLNPDSSGGNRSAAAGATYEWAFAPGNPAAMVNLATYRGRC